MFRNFNFPLIVYSAKFHESKSDDFLSIFFWHKIWSSRLASVIYIWRRNLNRPTGMSWYRNREHTNYLYLDHFASRACLEPIKLSIWSWDVMLQVFRHIVCIWWSWDSKQIWFWKYKWYLCLISISESYWVLLSRRQFSDNIFRLISGKIHWCVGVMDRCVCNWRSLKWLKWFVWLIKQFT